MLVATDHDRILPLSAIPPLSPGWVRRERLHFQLAAAVKRRLTVVTGPPGSGKTTLLSAWARHRPDGRIAWLSLRTADDDLLVFWRRIANALGDVDPSVRRGLRCEAQGGRQSPHGGLIERQLKDVFPSRPIVLILDDFHLITKPEILDSFSQLLGDLPSGLHIVLSSRQAVDLASHRLRLSGELAEIEQQDLHFDLDEAAALLSSVNLGRLAHGEIQALHERTEGWAAGLRLAALALEKEVDPAAWVRRFGGDSPPVADYLQSEVLVREPPELVDFLLTTSVLDRMTGELCQRLTGRSNADQILQELARRQLFVIRVDAEGGGYRYHRMLADLLRRRFAVEHPVRARQAHRCAAEQFKRAGDGHTAVRHLSEAGEYEEAFSLGVASVLRQLEGGLPLDHQPLLPGGLPEAYFEHDPARMYALVVALLCALRTTEARGWLRRLERTIRNHPNREHYLVRAERLWAIHAGLLGDACGVVHHFRRADAGRGQTDEAVECEPRQPDPEADTWLKLLDRATRGYSAVFLARARLWLGEVDEARRSLVTYSPSIEESDDFVPLGVLARIAYGEGRLRVAHALARRALEDVEQRRINDAVLLLDARSALGAVFWERDELPAAEEQFSLALQLSDRAGQTCWATAVECELIRIAMAQGHSDTALKRLGRIREAELHDPLPDHLLRRLNETEIRCRLDLGDLEGAVRTLKSIAPELRRTEDLARIDLCAGRPDKATARLSGAQREPAPLGVQLERLILLAVAELQFGDRRRADEVLRRAVEKARPDGYIRVFLDGAPTLLSLLGEMAGKFPDAYLDKLVARADHELAHPETAAGALVIEPLTDRERKLLSYLPSHLSQHEIGSSMYISVNTVKTHLRGVYRKLGAGSRSEAVAIARAHRLLR
jgi:LuxR family maltose regulon positive regulatory protein